MIYVIKILPWSLIYISQLIVQNISHYRFWNSDVTFPRVYRKIDYLFFRFFFRKILVRSLIELETWSFFQNVAYTYIMAGGNWFYACISKGSGLKWLGKFFMKIIWTEIGWKKYSIKLKFLSLISTLTKYLFAKFQVFKSFILPLIETCPYFASRFWCSFGL